MYTSGKVEKSQISSTKYGNSAMRPKLNRVLEGAYSEDVKEAAREALEKTG
jgi:hypothetical protein